MKKYIYSIIAVTVLLCTLPDVTKGQRRADVSQINISARVLDAAGEPVPDAMVHANEGAVLRYTDSDGSFTLTARTTSRLLVEAPGYKEVVVNLSSMPDFDVITLEEESIYAGPGNLLDRLDGGLTTRRDATAAIGEVDMTKASRYTDLQFTNTLQGTAAGLIVRPGTSGLGNNVSQLFIRGQHAYSDNTAKVIIDGIERPLDDILAEEIESIHILKDAAAKILYGPHAANGIVMVTTKRGQANKRIFKASAEYGVQPTMRNPEFLGSYDYANLYNEARANDGMSPRYLPYQLEGYRNSSGANDPLYPDVDWYKQFTRNMMNYRKAVVELGGGSQNVQYSLVTGYSGSSGLEKVGKRTDLNRINVRGNLDIRITDYLSVAADVAARIEIRDWSGRANDWFYGQISSNRPNEYPIELSHTDLGLEPNRDGSPYYGGSARRPENVYAEMKLGSETSERYANSQTNLGLKFDFDRYVKGLFADAYVTFDNYNYIKDKVTQTPDTYAIDTYLDENGDVAKRVTLLTNSNQSSDILIQEETTTRTIGARGEYRLRPGLRAARVFRRCRRPVLP